MALCPSGRVPHARALALAARNLPGPCRLITVARSPAVFSRPRQVPPSPLGYGEGGARPFHQDYRHYKYYGFAGQGAKTSWAFNPKYSK